LSLREVIEPALELASDGFAMYPGLQRSIIQHSEKFATQWPTSAAIYLPGGSVPKIGDRFRQPDWAASFSQTVEAEDAALRSGADRRAALRAARDVFYRGPIARAIARFAAETSVLDHSGASNSGILAYEDLAGYETTIEDPVSADYRGYEVYKCGPWSQGPVFLQQLRLLEGFDLRGLGHNTVAYIHTVVEAAKLAFADRDRYYGDPLFAQVPMERLLSRSYADERRALIDAARASLEIRPGEIDTSATAPLNDGGVHRRDTTHLDAIDADGLMISATPSGGWMPSSPVVEGLGFPLGTRAQMFSLDPAHPNCIAPGKRPRTTLTPSLVMREGTPYMVFGTPGGDQQDQWTLQFFLNVVEFGMDLQAAADAATFHTDHLPSSFYPREIQLGSLEVEGRIDAETRTALEGMGHRVDTAPDWVNGQVCGARIDVESGRLEAAASPRGQTAYAMGY
ncbi:MAG: gamma-glutamyltransferase, partial [Chloroflexi bacterium]|nr:gamma-glutamyltransferase [Chloroflexota bacterium]